MSSWRNYRLRRWLLDAGTARPCTRDLVLGIFTLLASCSAHVYDPASRLATNIRDWNADDWQLCKRTLPEATAFIFGELHGQDKPGIGFEFFLCEDMRLGDAIKTAGGATRECGGGFSVYNPGEPEISPAPFGTKIKPGAQIHLSDCPWF